MGDKHESKVHIHQRKNGERVLLLSGTVENKAFYSEGTMDVKGNLMPGMKVNLTVRVIRNKVKAYYSGRLIQKDEGLAVELEKFSFAEADQDETRVFFDRIIIKGDEVDLLLPVVERD